MIVTDMCAFVHAWVISLEYQFLYEKDEKYITFCLIIMETATCETDSFKSPLI